MANPPPLFLPGSCVAVHSPSLPDGKVYKVTDAYFNLNTGGNPAIPYLYSYRLEDGAGSVVSGISEVYLAAAACSVDTGGILPGVIHPGPPPGGQPPGPGVAHPPRGKFPWLWVGLGALGVGLLLFGGKLFKGRAKGD